MLFTVEGYERAPKEALEKLRACHVTLPADATWNHYSQLLRPPKGVRAKSLHEFFSGKMGEKTAVRIWAKKSLASLGTEALIRMLSFLDRCSTSHAAAICGCVTLSRVLSID